MLYADADAPRPILSVVLSQYQSRVLPCKSALTIYQTTLLFQKWHATIGRQCLTDLTPERLGQWRDCWLQKGLAPQTVRQRLWLLHGVLRWGVERGLLLANPMDTVAKPATSRRPLCRLSTPQRRKLLAACHASTNAYLYPLVLLTLMTGLRKHQVCGLRWDALDMSDGTLVVVDGAGLATRLSLREPMLWRLRLQSTTRDPGIPWVFPSRTGTGPVTPYYGWRKACQQAGLPGLRFEDLRHDVS